MEKLKSQYSDREFKVSCVILLIVLGFMIAFPWLP